MALLADVVAALGALLPQRTLSAPPSASSSSSASAASVGVAGPAPAPAATALVAAAAEQLASARNQHELDLLAQLRAAMETIVRDYSQPCSRGRCAARLVSAARARLPPLRTPTAVATRLAAQRRPPPPPPPPPPAPPKAPLPQSARPPKPPTITVKLRRHRRPPLASCSSHRHRQSSSRNFHSNVPATVPEPRPSGGSLGPFWSLLGAAVAVAAAHLPFPWPSPWGSQNDASSVPSIKAPFSSGITFPLLSALTASAREKDPKAGGEGSTQTRRSPRSRDAEGDSVEKYPGHGTAAVATEAAPESRRPPSDPVSSPWSHDQRAKRTKFTSPAYARSPSGESPTSRTSPTSPSERESSAHGWCSPSRADSWASLSSEASTSSSCTTFSYVTRHGPCTAGGRHAAQGARAQRHPHSAGNKAAVAGDGGAKAAHGAAREKKFTLRMKEERAPQCVVLMAPKHIAQKKTHSPRRKVKEESAFPTKTDRARSPRVRWEEEEGAEEEEAAAGAAAAGRGAAEGRRQRSRSAGPQRKAPPEALHGLPAALLARILSRHFAGVEMSALSGACEPLERAGGFALRSALWHLRRDLDARAELLHAALRRAQAAARAPRGPRELERAQSDAQALLVSLLLLEEARGELAVLAAHAGAWPRAGASSRLAGLLAGCVLDDGRRLLRLLPVPPQPPARPRRGRTPPPSAPPAPHAHPLQLPPLAAGAAADAVCTVCARLGQILASEAAAAACGAKASALGACALALLESCPYADAMLVVTTGGGGGGGSPSEDSVRAAAPGGDARLGDAPSPAPGAPAPGGVQVLALYEVRGLEEPPPPWPPVPPSPAASPASSSYSSSSSGCEPRPPEALAGAAEATAWLRALGAAVRKQRRLVAAARFEMFDDVRRCAEAPLECVAAAPTRRSHLTRLAGGGGGERHLLERRWPARSLAGLRAQGGGGVRVMLELRCARRSAPPVLRSLLAPPADHALPAPLAAAEDAFAFFAWRAP